MWWVALIVVLVVVISSVLMLLGAAFIGPLIVEYNERMDEHENAQREKGRQDRHEYE